MTRRRGEGAATTADVYAGDAFDLIDKIEPGTIDLIVTSPPYWGQRTYDGQNDHNWEIREAWSRDGGDPAEVPPYDWYRSNGGVLGLEPMPEWFIGHLIEWFHLARPKLKVGGSLWVNLGDTYFSRWASIRPRGRQGLGDTQRIRRRTPMGGYRQEKQLLLIPARFAIAMQEDRWILRNDVIWHKPNIPPRPERDRLRLAHEHFFHFVLRPKEGRPTYFYDLDQADGSTDVVTINVKPGSDGHSATFPPDLVRPRILSSSPSTGVVLDPFCGTGRALVVAAEAGRSVIGFELSDDYAEVAGKAVTEIVSRR